MSICLFLLRNCGASMRLLKDLFQEKLNCHIFLKKMKKCQHKQVVLELGIGNSEEYKTVLGVVYDEMVRKEWENKSGE